MNKTCFKCNKRKHISQYYLHPKTRDKHLNKCKDCTKKDAREIRFNPKYREKILENDRLRNKNNKLRKHKHDAAVKKATLKFPGKRSAVTAVNNAVKAGKIKKLPCIICGDIKSEGHHKDYRKKLDVIWLCSSHHKQEHYKK